VGTGAAWTLPVYDGKYGDGSQFHLTKHSTFHIWSNQTAIKSMAL